MQTKRNSWYLNFHSSFCVFVFLTSHFPDWSLRMRRDESFSTWLCHHLMASHRQLYIKLFIPTCHMEEVEKCWQSVVSLLIGDAEMSRMYAVCESVGSQVRKRYTSYLRDYSCTVGRDERWSVCLCVRARCIFLCMYVLMWKRWIVRVRTCVSDCACVCAG